MNDPVSQFITSRGCIIQGVMKNHNEMNYIYCPEHGKTERVYSFKREVKVIRPLSDGDKKLIKRLRSEFKEKPDKYQTMEETTK